MMKNSSLVTCDSCGGELSLLSEGRCEGLRCSCCGWSLVTTRFPDIEVDDQEYKVFCSGDYSDLAHVRAVSEVVSCNFLMSREVLRDESYLVFSGPAVEVVRVKRRLESVGVECVIKPDFNWS